MRVSYEDIYLSIRDKFKVSHKTGRIDDDFMRDRITLLTTVRLSSFKYQCSMKVSEECPIPDGLLFDLELETSRPIWRLNQKRIRHGLVSWF